MHLPPFLLDHWLAKYEFRTPPVRYNLASSTGPTWTLAELQALPHGGLDLAHVPISYAPPDGSRDLREAIAAHQGVDPDWVIVTTGASEALSILFSLAAEPGANVILPAPGYPAYGAVAEAWRLGVKEYVLRRDAAFRPDLSHVSEQIDAGTVLALVNTPHMPTGGLFPRADLEVLADGLRTRGVPLVVDEVFHPLLFGEAPPSAADIENAIVIGDMSKALSLAGLRVGWIIDRDPERRKRIINVRSLFTVSGSPISEVIAAHALRNRGAVLSRLMSVASANLQMLTNAMEAVKDVVSWVRPSGATTAYPWFNDGRDSRPFCETLAEAGVLIVPGDCFGEREHMRIGFGTQAEGFDKAAAILREAIICVADHAA